MYCNAAMPPAYIRLLTSYMRLGPWEVSQGYFKESIGLQIRRNPNIGAHDCETRIASKTHRGYSPRVRL